MQSAGDLFVFILPIPHDSFTLANLSTLNFSSFPTFSIYDGETAVESNHPKFCSNCYYYVVVTTKTSFVGQVMFLRLLDPIPLTTNHILKQRLSPATERAMQNLIFYSLSTFNITFNILSGKIEVKIVDPDGNTVAQEDMEEQKTFCVKSLEYKDK